jgi:hypothetical protein
MYEVSMRVSATFLKPLFHPDPQRRQEGSDIPNEERNFVLSGEIISKQKHSSALKTEAAGSSETIVTI